jgi:hypothetical protein
MWLARRFTEKRALLVTLCWVAVLAVNGSTDALLFLAPALLIAIPILCGRYFGEELIAKLAARPARVRPGPAVAAPLTPRAPRTWLPRGAHLLAFSLAERPPPAAHLAQI